MKNEETKRTSQHTPQVDLEEAASEEERPGSPFYYTALLEQAIVRTVLQRKLAGQGPNTTH